VMVTLAYLGGEGMAGSPGRLRCVFEVGYGTIYECIDRVITALSSLRKQFIYWPEGNEQKEISSRIQDRHGFPNCIGIIDGTLFPLHDKPITNGEDYFSRKSIYAIHGLIVCDDVGSIRNFIVGWPGCVHDNRVWSRSKMNTVRDNFFSKKQYLLGDSAFSSSPVMVSSYKCPPRGVLSAENEFFNDKLAKVRIKSEHCIGMLKARFPYLKNVRMRLETSNDMKRFITIFTTAAILHNMLRDDSSAFDYEEKRDNEDDDDNLDYVIDENDEMLQGFHHNGQRREEIKAFLMELYGH